MWVGWMKLVERLELNEQLSQVFGVEWLVNAVGLGSVGLLAVGG